MTTGDDLPFGISVFQALFLSGPNSTGGPATAEMPDAWGPRNCGQSSANNMPAQQAVQSTSVKLLWNITPPIDSYQSLGGELRKRSQLSRIEGCIRWQGSP
jgi:hypothetical protein